MELLGCHVVIPFFTLLGFGMKFTFVRRQVVDNSMLLIVSILLEQSFMMSKKLERIPGLKYFIFNLLFMLMVITHGYRGILTRDLTSPLPVSKLEFVDAALDLGYQILIPTKYPRPARLEAYYNAPFVTADPKSLLLYLLSDQNNVFDTIYRARDILNGSKSPTMVKILRYYQHINLSATIRASTEHELLKCNKTVLMVEERELSELIVKLKQYP